jgi:hypothetical protein
MLIEPIRACLSVREEYERGLYMSRIFYGSSPFSVGKVLELIGG